MANGLAEGVDGHDHTVTSTQTDWRARVDERDLRLTSLGRCPFMLALRHTIRAAPGLWQTQFGLQSFFGSAP